MENNIIHKPFFLSALSDPSPFGVRASLCGKEVKGIEVHSQWKYVNCPDCLSPDRIQKIDEAKKKRNTLQSSVKGRRILNENPMYTLREYLPCSTTKMS